MERKYILVSERSYKSYGVKVIINQILKKHPNYDVCFKISNIPVGSKVIPYGLLMAMNLVKNKNYSLDTVLLIDAYSLGESSSLKYLWSKSYVPIKMRMRMVLKYFKFLFYEKKVFESFNEIVLVSWGDKEYYSKLWLTKKYANKIRVVQNGVNVPQLSAIQRFNSEKLVIGCLSVWASITFYMLILFLNEVWKKLPSQNNVELLIAGRGLDDKKIRLLKKYPNIKILGEVESLNEFYSKIDISLVTMIKKCGIINRVLDGFSYNVPVICHQNSILAFKNLPDCCYIYTDYKSFNDKIDEIRNNPDKAMNKASDAFEFVKLNHDWDKNYSKFDI